MKESGNFDLKSKLSFLNKIKHTEEKPTEVPAAAEPRETPKSGNKFFEVVRILWLAVYRLRSVFLAVPVSIAALRLAAYNSDHLPEQVGLNLQSTGEFAKVISRQSAVTIPLLLTGGCLALMCFSKKPLYPWLISVFTLVIPLLLLITNIYPA